MSCISYTIPRRSKERGIKRKVGKLEETSQEQALLWNAFHLINEDFVEEIVNPLEAFASANIWLVRKLTI